ncbi:MAG: AMP-binding protein [Rhodocyclaceae bacterium]|nr:AMP-binding protein [Rhodocyclaceae bacterium]
MSLLRQWLSRAARDAPALVLPGAAVLTYGELAALPGRAGLQALAGGAAELARGLVETALGDGTAFPLPPHLTPQAQSRLIAQAHEAASPRLPLILATSGSSGAPKAVRLGWRSLAAAARLAGRHFELGPGDAWLVCLPLYFIGGAVIPFRTLRAGATAVVLEGFEAAAVAEALADWRISHVSLVPAMLARLLEAGLRPPPTLRLALIGGAALDPALAARAREAGWPIRLSYGMTETCATALVDGRPLAGVRLRLAPGGALEIASPARMAGYLGEADCGEWFTTSDLARFEADGRVTILGRADEMLVTGGANVHPLEVEAQLSTCPGVAEAAVTGLPDPVWGDLLACAYVGETDEAALEAWCRQTLPAARRPRRFLRVSQLPRLPSGKLDRRALRRLWP